MTPQKLALDSEEGRILIALWRTPELPLCLSARWRNSKSNLFGQGLWPRSVQPSPSSFPFSSWSPIP